MVRFNYVRLSSGRVAILRANIIYLGIRYYQHNDNSPIIVLLWHYCDMCEIILSNACGFTQFGARVHVSIIIVHTTLYVRRREFISVLSVLADCLLSVEWPMLFWRVFCGKTSICLARSYLCNSVTHCLWYGTCTIRMELLNLLVHCTLYLTPEPVKNF